MGLSVVDMGAMDAVGASEGERVLDYYAFYTKPMKACKAGEILGLLVWMGVVGAGVVGVVDSEDI